MKNFIFFALILSLFLSACRSAPVHQVPEGELSAVLVFDRIEAENPNHLALYFTLETDNPFPVSDRIILQSRHLEVNGQRAAYGFTVEYPQPRDFQLSASASNSFPVRVNLDMTALAEQGLAPADEFQVRLYLGLGLSNLPARLEVSGLAVFPGVQTPVFTITAIAVLRAELINTRFRVSLRIDNPNPFPVVLHSISYALYGDGVLWADGIDRDIVRVEARSSVQGNLHLLMNFIDMSRALLDRIIHMDSVNYRFTGTAQINTGIDFLPSFKTDFDLSGYSQVFDD